MGSLIYFGAVGVVLGAIWLFQGGRQAQATPSGGVARSGNTEGGSGGGELLPGVARTPYTYGYGEQPAQDGWSPYGGTNDNGNGSQTQLPISGSEPSRIGPSGRPPVWTPDPAQVMLPPPTLQPYYPPGQSPQGVRPGVRYA